MEKYSFKVVPDPTSPQNNELLKNSPYKCPKPHKPCPPVGPTPSPPQIPYYEQPGYPQYPSYPVEPGYPQGPFRLAHAYVPWQYYTVVYSPAEALQKGTLFPELYQPQGEYGPCEGPQPCRIGFPWEGGHYGC